MLAKIKIIIQRRFWESRTEIHKLLYSWFLALSWRHRFGHSGKLLDFAECCQDCREILFPVKLALRLHSLKRDQSFIRCFSIGIYWCCYKTVTKSVHADNSLSKIWKVCLILQSSTSLNILPFLDSCSSRLANVQNRRLCEWQRSGLFQIQNLMWRTFFSVCIWWLL